jgi:uncharacterized SAM-binding protein YcdF (DUF218 family)
MLGLGTTEFIILLFIAGIVAVALVPWFLIYKKVGYSPAMGCLMFIPLVNIIMLFVLAFSQWPIERELENARRGTGAGPT